MDSNNKKALEKRFSDLDCSIREIQQSLDNGSAFAPGFALDRLRALEGELQEVRTLLQGWALGLDNGEDLCFPTFEAAWEAASKKIQEGETFLDITAPDRNIRAEYDPEEWTHSYGSQDQPGWIWVDQSARDWADWEERHARIYG